MTEFVFVKPAEGARVRQPDRNSNVMPAEGAVVARNVYYERLIITGELIVDDAKTADYALAERQKREQEAKAEAQAEAKKDPDPPSPAPSQADNSAPASASRHSRLK